MRALAWARRRRAAAVFAGFCLLTAGFAVASRLGWLDAWTARLFPRFRTPQQLTSGDFPAGVSAPVGDVASVPLRPVRVGFTPRGSSSALLLAVGGAVPSDRPESAVPGGSGVLKTAYALEARAVVYAREDEVRKALALGVERGGVDLAAVSVDRLAAWMPRLRDAAPRTVLLLGRSQGQEALAAVGAPDLSSLQGRRLAVDPQGSGAYFALWLLSRAGLGAQDVRWVDLPSSLHAGPVLREGRADAVVGLRGDVERAALDRGGAVLATTADAPHLLATVLVARGDFAARYPDALRRVIRSLLDAAAIIQREPALGAQPLGEVAPYLGDPTEAVSSDPPAGLRENLAFFAISGEAPVTYAELMESASALWFKVGVAHAAAARPQETADLAVLRSLAGGRRP